MLIRAHVVFAASIVTSVSGLSLFGEDLSRKLLDSIRSAEQNQYGLATIFRVRATSVGLATNPALTGTDTIVFCIRTSSRIGKESVFVTSSSVKDPDRDKVVEFMAKVDDRIFGGSGTNFTAVVPRDITDMAKDDNWAKTIEFDWKRLSNNPMALPFLTIDSFYVLRNDFTSVHSRLDTCSLSYADESGLVSVWENPKVGVVLEVKLAKQSNNLPIESCFYLRPKNAKRLMKGDKLGVLLYRTRTEWTKLESPRTLREPAKSNWVPKRIEMEHLPTRERPNDGYSYVEILPVCQHVPHDILSDIGTAKEFVIGQESIPPTSRIDKLYFDLESRLERVIADAELEMQKRP